ncbi:MAG: hypothetical protein WC417_06365 [Candidatus Omnitrophota bacterium]|jgi:hypothetical protein
MKKYFRNIDGKFITKKDFFILHKGNIGVFDVTASSEKMDLLRGQCQKKLDEMIARKPAVIDVAEALISAAVSFSGEGFRTDKIYCRTDGTIGVNKIFENRADILESLIAGIEKQIELQRVEAELEKKFVFEYAKIDYESLI